MDTMVWIAVILFLIWWAFQESDFTLKFYELFGKSEDTLAGKVAWITGAGSGIGRCLALHWASKSTRLVLTDINSAALEEVKTQCLSLAKSKDPSSVLLLPGDITDHSNHQKWFSQIVDNFGHLDVLVNNAGRAPQGSFAKFDTDSAKQLFDLNVFAHVGLTQTVLPHFMERKEGYIATVASVLGRIPIIKASSYCASKAAVLMYFNGLRNEIRGKNISVTTICPGLVQTPIFRNADKFSIENDVLIDFWPSFLNPIRPERVAQLMSVAIVNKMGETWISSHPMLLAYYMHQHFTGLTNWVMTAIMAPILKKYGRFPPEKKQ